MQQRGSEAVALEGLSKTLPVETSIWDKECWNLNREVPLNFGAKHLVTPIFPKRPRSGLIQPRAPHVLANDIRPYYSIRTKHARSTCCVKRTSCLHYGSGRRLKSPWNKRNQIIKRYLNMTFTCMHSRWPNPVLLNAPRSDRFMH
jgi:hypothetical protein